MADITQITKLDKILFADDGAKRGPMTMSRLCYHPRGQKLMAQIADRRLALFDLNAEPVAKSKGTGKHIVGELVCPHEIGWVRGFDIHPAGHAIATGGSDRTLRLWPCVEGRPAESPAQQVTAHHGWVDAVAYSPNGKLLVSAGADKLVKVWNADDLALIETLSGHKQFVTDATFTRDGRHFVTGGEDGQAIVWETASFKLVRTITFGGNNDQQGQQPRHSGVHRLAISHDDHWLGIAGGESLSIFDLNSGETVASEKLDMQVAFHPTANLLAGGENDVKFWNYDASKFAAPKLDKNGKLTKAAGIPGKLLATVKRGDWSLGLCFSPDGSQVALGKADGTVELHQVT